MLFLEFCSCFLVPYPLKGVWIHQIPAIEILVFLANLGLVRDRLGCVSL